MSSETVNPTTKSDRLGDRIERAVRLPRFHRYLARIAHDCDPGAVVVDLGCGGRSALPGLLPHLNVIGIDSDEGAVAEARAAGLHAEVIHADLSNFDHLRAVVADREVQMVCLIHVIEHFSRREALELLAQVETLTGRFVLLETPNRFQPQGPEYGNEGQRHLSGWFPHDFEALGYTVRGTAGTRYLRGYAGAPRLPTKGGQSLDFLLARVLIVERAPRHAYALTAWKDVRGVSARLG